MVVVMFVVVVVLKMLHDACNTGGEGTLVSDSNKHCCLFLVVDLGRL